MSPHLSSIEYIYVSMSIKQRCYLVSPKIQEAICEEVDKMLAADDIELLYSEWYIHKQT